MLFYSLYKQYRHYSLTPIPTTKITKSQNEAMVVTCKEIWYTMIQGMNVNYIEELSDFGLD